MAQMLEEASSFRKELASSYQNIISSVTKIISFWYQKYSNYLTHTPSWLILYPSITVSVTIAPDSFK